MAPPLSGIPIIPEKPVFYMGERGLSALLAAYPIDLNGALTKITPPALQLLILLYL